MSSGAKCETEIDAFIEEHLKGATDLRKWQDAGFPKDLSPLKGKWPIRLSAATNVLSIVGHRHLNAAAICILKSERLDRRVTLQTARDAILKAYDDEITHLKAAFAAAEKAGRSPPNEIRTKRIERQARNAIRDCGRVDGIYVLPVVLGRRWATTEFSLGPIRILAAPLFLERHNASLDRLLTEDPNDRVVGDWKRYSENYDHFLCVDASGYEQEKGWPAARDAAEVVLNLLRITFGFAATERVRLGLQFAREEKQSTLFLSRDGDPYLNASYGGTQPNLPENWMVGFEREVGIGWPLVGDFVRWFLEAPNHDNPVIQRLIYANRLFAEAYSEPSEPMRLVRVISALEALSATSDRPKAHSIALRCSYVGAWGRCDRAVATYDTVARAYSVRNMIVHGDIPLDDNRAQQAFLDLDGVLLDVVVGFYAVYRLVSFTNPQSIAAVRRQLDLLAPTMLWSPSDFFNF